MAVCCLVDVVDRSFAVGSGFECFEAITQLVWGMLRVKKAALGSVSGLDD